jgi:hypothetical protein
MFEGNTAQQQPRNRGENKFVPGRKIEIRFIDHGKHRYETVGDWYESGEIGTVIIDVSKMKDPRYEFLVAVHELIEMYLCDFAGITEKEVDKFDMGPGKDSDDPGMESEAPYRHQHLAATGIEMQLAALVDVDWKKYEEYLESL